MESGLAGFALMKEEIRKYKRYEGEKARKLTWERARKEVISRSSSSSSFVLGC
jgi:hypothetical protein